MRQFSSIFLISIVFFSCTQESDLKFSEYNLVFNEGAVIEINIPRAEDDSELGRTINKTLNDHICNALNFSEEPVDTLDLKTAANKFNSEYNLIKQDHEETAVIWEALFDGEVTYQSLEVICIAINSFINTGGAHGNMNITLYNFDGASGEVMQIEDLIDDMEAFTEFVKPYFENEIKAKGDESLDDYFFDEPFHLPANIGINDDGILMLYNVYEIASYAQGITEFTIPFEDVERFLKIQ